MKNTLEISSLVKKYGKKTALDKVSYVFGNGIYGILGPNGAGKSTLMNIITTGIIADEGNVIYNGKDIKGNNEYKKIIGYVPQQQRMYEEFTGKQYLGYFAALKGVKGKDVKKRIDDVLRMVNLYDVANVKIKAYSGGMKQRILIAQAFMSDFEILILDEPTVGLDPEERERFKTMLKDLSKDKIIILATHIVSDLDDIADYIIHMKNGKIV